MFQKAKNDASGLLRNFMKKECCSVYTFEFQNTVGERNGLLVQDFKDFFNVFTKWIDSGILKRHLWQAHQKNKFMRLFRFFENVLKRGNHTIILCSSYKFRPCLDAVNVKHRDTDAVHYDNTVVVKKGPTSLYRCQSVEAFPYKWILLLFSGQPQLYSTPLKVWSSPFLPQQDWNMENMGILEYIMPIFMSSNFPDWVDTISNILHLTEHAKVYEDDLNANNRLKLIATWQKMEAFITTSVKHLHILLIFY